jgi:hypothetical protein
MHRRTGHEPSSQGETQPVLCHFEFGQFGHI